LPGRPGEHRVCDPVPSDPSDVEVARLRWRCRRGMRELDVMLGRYLDRSWPSASPAERTAFAQLLELPDPDLFGYLVGRTTPDEEPARAVIAQIRRLAP
jgi:antitoxin CptB